MVNVFVERSFQPALTRAELSSPPLLFASSVAGGAPRWRESFIDRSWSRMICRFTAGHGAALRDALVLPPFDYEVLWTGTVHRVPVVQAVARRSGRLTYVIGERQLDTRVSIAELAAIEQACPGCLAAHRVRLVRMFVADDGMRVLALYRAPDAESVRLAHRATGMPLDRAWACRWIVSRGASQRQVRSGG